MTETVERIGPAEATRAGRAGPTGAWPWLNNAFVWNAAVTLVILSLAAAAVVRQRRVNHDVAYFIQCAQVLIDGGAPYIGFVDVNPPLIVYLNVPAAYAARALHVSPVTTFHLFVVILLAASTLAIARLLRHLRAAPAAAERGILLAFWVAASAYLWASTQFGQREHLFVLMYVPFLVLRVIRVEGASTPVSGTLAFVVGFAAGVGACIKPFFLIPVIAVEALLWIWHRRTRALFAPEVIALVIAGLAYAGHFALLPAEVRHAFFGRWVPLIRAGYAAYDVPGWMMWNIAAGDPFVVLCVVIMAFSLWFAVRARTSYGTLLGALSVAGLTSMAGYLLQRKGWTYHLIPVWAASTLSVAAIVAQSLRAIPERLPRMRRDLALAAFAVAPAAAALCVISVIHGGRGAAAATSAAGPNAPFDHFIEANTRPGDTVLVVSTAVMPAYPLLVIDNLRPGSRYLCSFPIAFFYFHDKWPNGHPAYHDRASATRDEQQFLADLEQDIQTRRPSLIAVQTTGGAGLRPDFDLNDYLEHAGTLAQAIRPAYHEVPGAVAGWHMYALRSTAQQER